MTTDKQEVHTSSLYAPPTLFKDSQNKQILAFSYRAEGPSVCFYDLDIGKEIAQAKTACIFIKYLVDKKDKKIDQVFLLRHPKFSQGKNEEERIEAIKAWTEKEYKGGYPIWYNCAVDFENYRKSSTLPVQLIDIKANDTESALEDVKLQKTPIEALEALKNHERWGITCEVEDEMSDDFLQNLAAYETGKICPYIREVKGTKGMFSVMIKLKPTDVYFFTARSFQGWRLDYHKCGQYNFEMTGQRDDKLTTFMSINEET